MRRSSHNLMGFYPQVFWMTYYAIKQYQRRRLRHELFRIQLSASEMIVLSRFPMGNKFSRDPPIGPVHIPWSSIIPYSKPYRRIPLVTTVRAYYRLAERKFHRLRKDNESYSKLVFYRNTFAFQLYSIELYLWLNIIIIIVTYVPCIKLRIIIIRYTVGNIN